MRDNLSAAFVDAGDDSPVGAAKRVLVHGLNYSPEATGIAPYTTNMAEALAERFGGVDAITGFPHYPRWRRDPEFPGMCTKQTVNGVSLNRVWHPVPRKPSAVKRVFMEIVFGFSSIFAIRRRYDVVICVTPALLSTCMVVFWLRVASPQTRQILWIQDLYGVGLSELGSSHERVVGRLFSKVEKFLARSVDAVVVIHRRFADHLDIDAKLNTEKMAVVVPNWTHLVNPQTGASESFSLRYHLGLPSDSVLVGHFGNMGRKQALHNVLSAAELAESSVGRSVHFVLVGDGSERLALEAQAERLTGVHFVDSLSASDFVPAMRSVDLLLVNEGAGVKEMCVPSKLTSYYAAGVPIVAACNQDGLTAADIEAVGGGIVVPPGDPEALLVAVRDVADNSELRRQLAEAGASRVMATDSFSDAVATFSNLIGRLNNQRSSNRLRRFFSKRVSHD